MNELAGVSISQAAALYELAPSTLRWWESQGLLGDLPRVNGRRVYTETELRRLGLAYLCCVTGAMPLEDAAVVTSGRTNAQWQDTVTQQVQLIDEKIRHLQDARVYLRHLLRCPDDDIVAECPDLDAELTNHTPRGHVTATSLVAAARSVATLEEQCDRDETGDMRDEMQIPEDRCLMCHTPLAQPPRGRRRQYCSRACQQRHYRHRTARSAGAS